MKSGRDSFSCALITGATGGLGLAFAHSLAKRNVALILTGRSQSRLEEIKKNIEEQYKTNILIHAADLSDSSDFKNLETFLNQNTCPDLFVNCAGSGIYGNFCDIPIEKMQSNTGLNVNSVIRLNKLLIDQMLKSGGGKIINVASNFAFGMVPNWSLYAASKAFVFSFSRSLREELKNSNIEISVLCPGAINTDFDKTAGYLSKNPNRKKQPPCYIAEYTIEHSNRDVILPEFKSRMFYYLFNRIPDNLLYFIRSRK